MTSCSIFKFKSINGNGKLTPIEANKDIPFDIKRVYYIYGVKNDVTRGFHAHKNLKQMLICVSGRVKIKTRTIKEEKVFQLDNPNIGLYLEGMIWREMYEFSPNAVLLVLASEYYDENDYIRDYNNYIKECRKCNW